MASTSEVKFALDQVAAKIRDQRAIVKTAIAQGAAASAVLAALTTDYADVIATINAYGTVNTFEALSKAELAKLSTEFNALKASADTIAVVTV